MAGAEYAERSAGAATGVGVLKVRPRSVEYDSIDTSWSGPRAPSLQASTISSVASAPVGAPLAMSTLGMAARSVRAPALPSPLHRPVPGSLRKQGSVMATTSRGGAQEVPPLSEVTTVWNPCREVPEKWVKKA